MSLYFLNSLNVSWAVQPYILQGKDNKDNYEETLYF